MLRPRATELPEESHCRRSICTKTFVDRKTIRAWYTRRACKQHQPTQQRYGISVVGPLVFEVGYDLVWAGVARGGGLHHNLRQVGPAPGLFASRFCNCMTLPHFEGHTSGEQGHLTF